MPALSIIMPCYNRGHDLIRALQAYDCQKTTEQFELIAVDDASTDSTAEVLNRYHPEHYQLRVEHQPRNQGPASARNKGLALAQAPLVLFVGDDILPHPDLVRGHLIAHRRHADPGVVILGKVRWPDDLPVNTLMAHIDGPGAEQFSYYYFRDGQEYDFRHFYTANISLKREFLMAEKRWFDTDFNYAAFEDVELSYRLSRRSQRIIYYAALEGYHYHPHNIWTFSTRQYRAGLMARVLIRKHPALRSLIMGKSWELRALRWRLQAWLKPAVAGVGKQLEEEVLHLGSSHEWTPHPELMAFYLKVLNYFYYKGLIYGYFGEKSELSRRVQDLYAARVLPAEIARLA